MDYLDFKEKAKTQDSRNNFCLTEVSPGIVPNQLNEFYKTSNPIDVEVRLEDYSQIRFYPIDKLEKLQRDYDLPTGAFCFATNNSDPIFVHNEKIFTISHDSEKHYECLADNFDKYLELLMKRM